jgi:hypothetical protein
MKTCIGVDVWIDVLLPSALVKDEFSVLRSGRFIAAERGQGNQWITGYLGPRTGLDETKRKECWLYRDSNSDPTTIQPVASHYTDWAIPVRNHVLLRKDTGTNVRIYWFESTILCFHKGFANFTPFIRLRHMQDNIKMDLKNRIGSCWLDSSGWGLVLVFVYLWYCWIDVG